ncbi:GlcNAc-binding protein A [Paenibacillus phage phiERICV]|uniref:GlcNAc-binding protein A n=1 Tax=Paenibacillus larvae subsp. larvae TaxID=147375 RepID=A0A6C0QMT3_9BACL|nr:S8 family serine peptidase [Paenibacillus larvae]QHZ50049.1 GlcNAc-binding protein A [Paenibacillus larvae subsp. larvae]QHZ54134.1 GlcNAc-binding protein A [Paenibacillus phage phiERICV]
MDKTLKTQDECTKIIVKFKDQVLQSTPLVLEEGNILTQGHDDFFSSFSDLTFERLIFTVSPEDMIQDLKTYNQPEDLSLFHYYSVQVSKDQGDPQSIVDKLKQSPLVETAYIEPDATEFDVSDSVAAMENLTKHGDIYAQPNRNPLFQKQEYLKPTPRGIDAQYAWNILGGDGEGITLVDMQLKGWLLDHEDLVDQQIRLVAGSVNDPTGKTHHGTATLGEVVGFDNGVGIIGISPKAQAKVTSKLRADGKASSADAIVSAAKEMNPGDVLVLTWGYIVNSESLPAEYTQADFDAIKYATDKGITVVQSAGNESTNLDQFTKDGKYIFNRNSPDFKDSGAIIVGAGSSNFPHKRLYFSSYGSRIDVYAWGENVTTTYSKDGDPSIRNLYTFGFNGTSSAGPIIAGAAVNLQGVAKANLGKPFTSKEVRDLLSDPSTGTPSNNPSSDKIGVMPDLKAILNKLGFKKELLTPPTELQATDIQANSVQLQWNPSTSNIGIDIKGYYIYRNGTLRAASLSPEFTDTDVEANTEYRYIVIAEDINRNVSEPSNEIKVRTKSNKEDLHEVQIVTVLDETKVLDKNGDNEVTLYSSHGGANQRWNFVYDKDKEAHQIKSVSNKDLVLAWNAIPNSRQVFATPNQNKEEQYWILEKLDDYFIIKSKKDPNLVLDVEGSKTDNLTKIIVNEQNNGKNQKFKLREV